MSTNDDLTAPADVSQLTPAQAGEMLRRMSGDPGKRPLPTDPHQMTREEAGKALERMAKTPLPSVDPVGDAIAGKLQNDVMVTSTPESPMLSPYKLNETVNALREIGFPDAGIRRIIEGTKTSAEEVAWARVEKDRAISDPEFVKRYLGGNRKERHWLTGMDAILAGGAEEPK
jgi:hypothetical protein